MRAREFAARWAGALGFGRRRDRELAEEVAFHRARLEEAHRLRGMSPEEARRAAVLEFGGQMQTVEAWRDQRGVPWIDMLRQDVRYALRTLAHARGFTIAALLTLSLGIGANAAMFSVVDAVLLRPLPFANASRVVTLGDRDAAGQSSNVGFATALDWRARSRSFSQIALMRSWIPTLVMNGEGERLHGVRVSANYFVTMGVAPALGRVFSEGEDTPEGRRVVILSDGLWRRRFNRDPSIVGRTITISDASFRVVGVMPQGFDAIDAEHYYDGGEIWAPLGYRLGGDSACRSCQHLRAFGLLAPGVSRANAVAEMNTIRAQMQREYPADYSDGFVAAVLLRDALTGDVRRPLYILFGAVGFVLLIACANVANLLIARSQARRRELAVRAVLGAGTSRLVRQLLTESTVLALAGGAGGLALATGLVRTVARLAPGSLPRIHDAGIEPRVIAFTFALALLTGTIFGLLPALRAAGSALSRTLALESRGSVGAAGRLRSVLVVSDLALALVLLTGAALMLRTVATLSQVHPGFDPGRTLTWQFSLVGNRYAEDAAVVAFQEALLSKIRGLPGVTGAALADQIPFGGNYDCRGFHARGRSKPNSADDPCIERYGITADYLSVMRIPLLAGRFIATADTARSQRVMVISNATRRLVWGDADPIGTEVRMGSAARGDWYTVVGVVGDVHHASLASPIAPAFYVPESQFTDSDLVAVVRTSTPDPDSLASAARSVMRDLDPNVPVYDVATLDGRVTDSASDRRFVMRLLGAFAGVALLLAAVGLYGVISFVVAGRTREIGLRMALGAQRSDVVRVVFSSAATLISAGVVIGIAAAAGTTRYLSTLIFGVSPMDPASFAVSVALLAAVAFLAHWMPVRRALKVDPATALRHD